MKDLTLGPPPRRKSPQAQETRAAPKEIPKEFYPGVVKATKSTNKRSAPAKASDADTGV